MSQEQIIYHGSDKIVENPVYGEGKIHNDYGLGFYCTENGELAKEWAVVGNKNGYANKYSIDLEYLNILRLNSMEYTILNWIAVLLEHRTFSLGTPMARRARGYLIEHFCVNVNAFDVVIGYRADDSYFDFAEAFIENSISVDQLAQAMKLGKLGEQIVLKSRCAFSKIKYIGSEKADAEEFYANRLRRNQEANQYYLSILEEDDGLYIRDIMKEGITNDDQRIPRNVSK